MASEQWLLVKYEQRWGGSTWRATLTGHRVQTQKEFDEWKKRVEAKFDADCDGDGELYRRIDPFKNTKQGVLEPEERGTIRRTLYWDGNITTTEIFADEADTLIELCGKEFGIFVDPLIHDEEPAEE